MNDNDLNALVWRTIAGLILAVALIVGGCTAYETKKIADMVKDGASPIAAHCAIHGGASDRSTCAIIAVKYR